MDGTMGAVGGRAGGGGQEVKPGNPARRLTMITQLGGGRKTSCEK